MANQPTPPNIPPPEIAGIMISAYENPLVSLNEGGVGWLHSLKLTVRPWK